MHTKDEQRNKKIEKLERMNIISDAKKNNKTEQAKKR